MEGGKTSSNWLYNKYKATLRSHLAPAREKLSTLYCCSGTETAHRWNCILYKWQGGGVEWQHGVTITKVVALVMHYGGKGGTGWQPGLGNKCGIVWYNAPGGVVAGWWQGGGIALCRWGTRVAAQSTIEVAPWVRQQNKCGIV